MTVPSELVEQTAKIELAQIASERKDAILQSITCPAKEYAIAFDHEAAKQRKNLSIGDRSELEDLLDELSTDGAKLFAVVGDKQTGLRAATKSKTVEIDYLVDHASHRIRITAIRPGVGQSLASTSGASHA